MQLKLGNVFIECMILKGLRPKTSEENQLKYVVQQNMSLWVLELGYDNEFQTQIFSLIVTKICEERRLSVFSMELVAFHYRRLIV